MKRRKIFRPDRVTESIRHLMGNQHELIYFLFSRTYPAFDSGEGFIEMKRKARRVSHGTGLLFLVALDILNGSGGANLRECLEVWDDPTFWRFLESLCVLRSGYSSAFFERMNSSKDFYKISDEVAF